MDNTGEAGSDDSSSESESESESDEDDFGINKESNGVKKKLEQVDIDNIWFISMFLSIFWMYQNFSSRKNSIKYWKKSNISPAFWRHSFCFFVYFFMILSFHKLHDFAKCGIIHMNFYLHTSLREFVGWFIIVLFIKLIRYICALPKPFNHLVMLL